MLQGRQCADEKPYARQDRQRDKEKFVELHSKDDRTQAKESRRRTTRNWLSEEWFTKRAFPARQKSLIPPGIVIRGRFKPIFPTCQVGTRFTNPPFFHISSGRPVSPSIAPTFLSAQGRTRSSFFVGNEVPPDASGAPLKESTVNRSRSRSEIQAMAAQTSTESSRWHNHRERYEKLARTCCDRAFPR